MKNVEMQVGRGELVEGFLSLVAAAPAQIRELTLISPFVQLTTSRGSAGFKICQLLADVNASGGSATLISDDTPARRHDFTAAISAQPDLSSALLLCKNVHAKCGIATNFTGNHVGFLGSANLTDAGLHHNAEVVFGVNSRRSAGQGWLLVGQLRLIIEGIRARSFHLN